MYYEINESGQLVRPLPGYYDGYHDDLAGVDLALLSAEQQDYVSLPLKRIKLASDTEIREYETRKANMDNTLKKLKETDLQMCRVIEDVVDLMINKGVITIDEIPREAIEHINMRKKLREKIINS